MKLVFHKFFKSSARFKTHSCICILAQFPHIFCIFVIVTTYRTVVTNRPLTLLGPDPSLTMLTHPAAIGNERRSPLKQTVTVNSFKAFGLNSHCYYPRLVKLQQTNFTHCERLISTLRIVLGMLACFFDDGVHNPGLIRSWKLESSRCDDLSNISCSQARELWSSSHILNVKNLLIFHSVSERLRQKITLAVPKWQHMCIFIKNNFCC